MNEMSHLEGQIRLSVSTSRSSNESIESIPLRPLLSPRSVGSDVSTPRLPLCQDCIDIHLSIPPHDSQFADLHIYKEWCHKRAGLDIVLSKDESLTGAHDHDQSLEILPHLLDRCRTLEIDLPSKSHLSVLTLSYLRYRTQLNPEVTLWTGNTETRQRHTFFLNHAPTKYILEHPILERYTWQWNSFRTGNSYVSNDLTLLSQFGSWTHTTHIDLHDRVGLAEIRNLLKGLQKCVQLHTLQVWNIRETETTKTAEYNEPHPQLAYLKSLHSLSLSGTVQLGQITRGLILPALKKLELAYIGRDKILPSESSIIDDLLVRSRCYLDTLALTFRTKTIDESTLNDFLTSGRLARLSRLDLMAEISDRAIDLLAAKRGYLQSMFMPNLVELHLRVCNVSDKKLSTMVSFRHRTPERSKLRKVAIITDEFHSVDEKEFSKMFEDGLKGSFLSMNPR